MDNYKIQLDKEIAESLKKGDSSNTIIRRIYSFNISPVFSVNKDIGFKITNDVCQRFSIPFRSIHIAGSAQTGYSYFKSKDFTLKESDLDLAIVDSDLFKKYFEKVYKETNGFTDLTKFSNTNGENNSKSFQNYIMKGYFRPDLMPNCVAKQKWFEFFNRLSNEYSEVFSNINCGIYLSEKFFEGKQTPIINKYKEGLI